MWFSNTVQRRRHSVCLIFWHVLIFIITGGRRRVAPSGRRVIMSRMESILHPIFCLFLYFKLVATFDGNFSKRVGHFLPFAKLSSVPVFLSFLLVFFFGWGSLTRNKLHVFHDGGIYIASQEQLWVFWFLLWKSRDSKIYFRTSQRREESLRSIWRLVRDLHSVGKFTQKVSRILQDYKKIAKKIIEFFTPKIYISV